MVLITTLALLVAVPAAAEEWQQVAPGDVKVSVGLDWTKAELGSHSKIWSTKYGSRTWVSLWEGSASGYPRIEINLLEAGPGYFFKESAKEKIGKGQLKNWSFFEYKNLAITDRSSEANFETTYFRADDTTCVYFTKVSKVATGREVKGGYAAKGFLRGYYCPNEKSDLTKEDVLAVLQTVRVSDKRASARDQGGPGRQRPER